uniref:Structural maintenance of chromosomes protein n=1 Tax=Strongyloides venezuelensis TaxID=75913 RepID=A0A0K0F921_STRVS
MKLEYIRFFHFKTYRGKVTLGPLSQLNAIIGGNGSGKSNIVDGIMFALNADVDKLRVNRMDFLIHGSNTGTPLSNNCSVELEFHENGVKTLTLTRKFFYNSSEKKSWSDYEINGENVSSESYMFQLSKLNLSGGLNNVVVGQGDIGFIVQMNPLQITNYLEELAGSGETVQKYKSLEEELKRYDTQFKLLLKNKKDSLEERKVMEMLEEKEQKKISLDTQLSEITKKKVNLETFKFLSDLSKTKEQLVLCERYIGEKDKKIQESKDKLTEYNRREQELLASKKMNHRNLIEHRKQFCRMTRNLHEMESKCRIRKKWIEDNLKRQEKFRNEEKNLREKAKELDNQISEYTRELEKVRNAYQSILEMDSHRMVMTREFKELDCLYNSRNSFLEISMKNKETNIELLRKNLQMDSSKLEELRNGELILRDKIKFLEDEIAHSTNDKKSYEDKFRECKSMQEELFINIGFAEREIQEIEDRIQHTKLDIAKKDKLRRLIAKDSKTKETVRKLKNLFGSSVLGRLEDLLKCKDVLYSDLFYSFIFDVRNTIVVKDFDSVLNCINFINQNNIERTIILSLDSLQIPDDVVGRSKIYTSDNFRSIKPFIVSSIEGTEKLVDYVCNNIIFCDEIDVATSLRKDSRFDKCKIVINDGTIFYKKRIQLNAIKLNILSETNSYNEKIIDLKDLEQRLASTKDKECGINIKLNEIESKIRNINESIKTRSTIINEQLLEKSMFSNELKCLEDEENILAKNISENNNNLKKIENKLDELTKSKTSLRDDIFRDFMKKYNVESLNPQDYLSTAPDVSKVIHQLQSKVNCLYEKKDSIKISGYSERLSILEIELEGVTKEVEDLTNKTKELSNSLATVETGISNYEESIKKDDNELKIINKSVNDVKSQLDILKGDSAETIQSLNFQIIDLKKKISTNVREYSYINVDENFSIESFNKSYLNTEYGELFEESLDDLLKEVLNAEKRLVKAITKLDFSTAHKIQFELLKGKILSLDNEINDIKVKRTKCTELFRKIKIERKKKFENLCNLLNEKMKEFMYKLFGSLDCSFYIQSNMSSAEPYLGETQIYCQMPRKQLRELSQLSTGEKKLVSLSMILACHQIKLPPFLIFDEVDANMDHERLKYLVATLKSFHHDVQFIVVSHVEEVFNQCGMIFGTIDNKKDEIQFTDILIIDMEGFD